MESLTSEELENLTQEREKLSKHYAEFFDSDKEEWELSEIEGRLDEIDDFLTD